jgi:hypothetical protein
MGKKLTSSAINSTFNKHFTKRKVIINISNSDYEVLVDEHIQQSKMENLFTELFEKQEYSKRNNLGLDISCYAQVLLLKYFTDIPMTNDLATQLSIYIKLKDLNVLDSIVDVLNETELNDMMPKIMKSLTTKIMSNEMVKYMSEHPEEAVKSFGLKELFKNEYNNIDESKESVESDESIVTE